MCVAVSKGLSLHNPKHLFVSESFKIRMGDAAVHSCTGTVSAREEAIIAHTAITFFSKETTDDPWEREFLLFYEPLRMDIKRASKLERRVRELTLELARLTNASSTSTGCVRIAMREMAQCMATSLHRLAVAVLHERG